MEATLTPTTYDTVPYPSGAYPQSHPRRLATLGALFGMEPADVQTARVLELGAANGANLIPMASELSSASFVGIERSGRQAEAGQQLIRELGLENVALQHGDILDIGPELGKFDYIIVHGIYSWVPAPVQQKILAVCRENLSKSGVAYISYNTFPGWRMRGMVRDMMLYHTAGCSTPEAKIQQARALVQFLAQAVPTENNPYGLWLKQEMDNLGEWRDDYVLHDSLEEVNDPVYFWQFMDRAAAHDLQYLGEAEFSTMVASNFNAEVRETLERIAKNITAMEQYMDFVRNRMFRQTLLCHREVRLERNLSAANIEAFHLFSPARPLSKQPDLTGRTVEKFVTPRGVTLSTGTPLAKTAMALMSQHYPHGLPFDELFQQAHRMVSRETGAVSSLPIDQQRRAMLEMALRSFAAGTIELSRFPYLFTFDVNEKPCTTALIRMQARAGRSVTSMRHEPVKLDALSRVVVQHLDGEHSHGELVELLVARAVSGKLEVREDGHLLQDEVRLRPVMQAKLRACLAKCAKYALLCN